MSPKTVLKHHLLNNQIILKKKTYNDTRPKKQLLKISNNYLLLSHTKMSSNHNIIYLYIYIYKALEIRP